MPSKLLQQFVSRKGNFSLAKQKGRLLAARCFGWAEACVEKVIFVSPLPCPSRPCLEGERRLRFVILRFADLAATYSPAS